MTAYGWRTGERKIETIWQLATWSQKTKWGKVFDNTTGFIFPDGTIHSPVVSWVELSRIKSIEPNPDEFLPLVPDFAIEFRDRAEQDLSEDRAKMQVYKDSGVRLSWLINFPDRQVEIYHIDRDRGVLEFPSTISGEDVLPWFELNLSNLWDS
jgi:Uma2 family endonuclease